MSPKNDYFRSEDEIQELRDRLESSERHISELQTKHETEVEMYFKMLADTRRIFSQNLKQNFDSGNDHVWPDKMMTFKPQ